MPTCVAEGCQRRGDALLKVFPWKDRRRRQIWVERVNRPGWIPTKYSSLCELHFDRDQWELPREDGKRKLKDSALPTIFVVPCSNDLEVARDHSYCLPFYRKIYEDIDIRADTPENGEEIIPIEHIKVEVEQNENFTPETVEEEGRDEDSTQEDAESIQCTPDISVYPEKGEPFPIEMVDCENKEMNPFLADPTDDPLAISAEDQVQAATVKPYFGNTQKFVFVPKETKLMVNISMKAKGDPEVKRLEPTGCPIAKPTLKVKSLDGLLDPNVVLKSSSIKSASVDSEVMLRSPSAVYLKEALTMSDKPDTSDPKLETVAPKKKLEIDQRVVTLTSPHYSFPPRLKVISAADASPPRLNLVSTQISVQKDPNFIRKTTNLKIEKSIILPTRPNILINKPDTSKTVRFISPIKRIQPGLLKSNDQQILADRNIKITLKPGDEKNEEEIKILTENKKFVEPVQKHTEITNIFLDHDYGNNQMPSPLCMDGAVKEGIGCNKQIGNNDVRRFLKSNKSVSSSSLKNVSLVQNNKKSALKKNSSIIIVNQFDSSKSPEYSTGGNLERNINKIKLLQGNKIITMYKCDQCHISFINPLSLQLHQSKTGHFKMLCLEKPDKYEGRRKPCKAKDRRKLDKDEDRKEHNEDEDIKKHDKDEDRRKHDTDECRRKQYKDRRKHNKEKEEVVTIELSSESSNDSKDNESLDDDSSDILSEDDSETDTAPEISYFLEDSFSSETDSASETANEEGEKKEIGVANTSQTASTNIFKRNGILRPPSIDTPLPSPKILKSKRVFYKDKVSDKTPVEKNKPKALSSRSELKTFEENTVENYSEMEDTLSTFKAKLTRKMSNKAMKVLQHPVVWIPKIDLNQASQKEVVASLKDDSIEEELVVLSDDSVDEFSSTSEDKSSNIKKNLVTSLSKLDVNYISELKTKKKKVEMKDGLLQHTSYKDGSSIKPYKAKANSCKPAVLSPKVYLKKSKSLKSDRNNMVDSPDATCIVLSDDEDLIRKEKINLGKENEKYFHISEVHINHNKGQEKIPDNEDIVVEHKSVGLTFTNKSKTRKEKKGTNENPTILLPKLECGIKRKYDVETNYKRVKIENVNNTKTKHDDYLIADELNYESNCIHTVPSLDKTCSKELRSYKAKMIKTPSVQKSETQIVRSETKNTLVRRNKKPKTEIDSQNKDVNSTFNNNEEDSISKTIPQTNRNRITRNRLKNLDQGNKETVCQNREGSKANLFLNSKKTYASVRTPKEKKGLRTISNSEKPPKSPTKKCKLCGEVVEKSQLIRHILQHSDTSSVCKVCKKKFSHIVLLRRHMKIEHFV